MKTRNNYNAFLLFEKFQNWKQTFKFLILIISSLQNSKNITNLNILEDIILSKQE